MNNELEVIKSELSKSEIQQELKVSIETKFMPIVQTIEEWKVKVESLVVTDESQKDLMKQAREGRLILKNLRVSADKERKAMKDESQKYLNTIQWVYNKIEGMITPLESHLYNQENYIEIQEAIKESERKEQIAKLQKEREKIVESMDLFSFLPAFVQLGDFSEEDFQQMMDFAKFKKEQKIAQQKEEEENKRIESERLKAEAEERQRLIEEEREKNRVEMERLKAEAQEKERLLNEEKAKLKLIEDERIRAEKEALKLQKEKDKELRKLNNAPDKVKIEKLIEDIKSFQLPNVQGDDAKSIIKDVKSLLDKIVVFVETKNQDL